LVGEISEFWLEAIAMAERRRKTPIGLPIVVQVTSPRVAQEVASELRRRGYKVMGIVEDYVFADVREPADIEIIARLPYVEYVTVQKFFYPMAFGPDELFKRLGIMMHPVLKHLSIGDLNKLGITVRPAAEIPPPFDALVANLKAIRSVVKNPLNVFEYIKGFPPVIARAGWKLVTYTRELLGVPRDNRLRRTYVGVIDTGVRYGPGLGSPLEIKCISISTPPEPPVDTMSHGSWCHACAFGKPAITRYGNFYPVANAPKSIHVKVFSAFGPCSSYQVIKAMEICAKNGCKVVSLSLGGTLTDRIDKDPETRLVDKLYNKYGTIFVIAAGNEDGKFEIGSPGAALKALTVAALDWKEVYHTSSYSSRGWQGKWYLKHKDVFEQHLAKWGDEFLKPDCGGIGGDRDSQIVSACSPWYDGVYDFVPDGWDLMIGTSMATPHIAGLVALAIDRELLPQDVDKIKEVLRATASEEYIFGGEIMDGKSHEQGWGVFKWERLK